MNTGLSSPAFGTLNHRSVAAPHDHPEERPERALVGVEEIERRCRDFERDVAVVLARERPVLLHRDRLVPVGKPVSDAVERSLREKELQMRPSSFTASRSSASSATDASIRPREKSSMSRPCTIDHSPLLHVAGNPEISPSVTP